MDLTFTPKLQKKLRIQYFSATDQSGKLQFAQTCLHLTRRGYCLADFFAREGLTSLYQEALDASLELYSQRKQGHLYLAVNPIYTAGLYKIGATRKLPQDRMHTLRTAGIPGRFTLVQSWAVPDVFYAEAQCRRRLAKRRVQREFYAGTYGELTRDLQCIVDEERGLMRKLSPDLALTTFN